MAASNRRKLSRIKRDPNDHLLPRDAIESACRAAGYRWRQHKLGPSSHSTCSCCR
jgi:hypothetical protein